MLVTDKGQPLLGLVPGDFEVRDNGVPQQVDLVNFDEIPLNVTLALDMSDSVAGERLGRLRAAAGGLLAGLRPKDQAALITLSHIVQLRAGLTTDLESVRAALDKAQAVGETALVDGTYAGIMVGESDVGRSLLIVFSDGVDTSSWLSPHGVLDIAKRSDVVAYGVSTRSPLNPAFLRDLTSITGGQLFEVEKTANLEMIFLESTGRIPAAISAQLHAPGRGTRRVASTRRPREAKCHGQGSSRVSGGTVKVRSGAGPGRCIFAAAQASVLARHVPGGDS